MVRGKNVGWVAIVTGIAVFILALAAIIVRCPGSRIPRPNVVLVSLDTLRPDHLGCYGYPKPTSPNLDAFAKDAILFTNAHSQASWTLPSHMSLFTSMLPSHNGVEDLNERLPDGIPTLTEILKQNGYTTVALVNNGEMKAHWGFGRGFETWREFEVDTPEGSCENITGEALEWLAGRAPTKAGETAAEKPFFLFLHYFDPHDPYNPPESYRARFGCTLAPDEIRQAVWDARPPGRDIRDKKILEQVIAAYDGEIAWLDHELGKLFAAIPPNTLTVIFSDHGEAFEEHGWTLHGASLYEEETRVALVMKAPGRSGSLRPGVAVAEPAMLLDVAPTILSFCGVEVPPHWEGRDLFAVMSKGTGPRIVKSETKWVLEGQAIKSVTSYPWKLIAHVLEGRQELYKLPDEHANLIEKEPGAAEALFARIREWMSPESFWIVYAKGNGRFEATASLREGQFIEFIPLGFEEHRDYFEPKGKGREMHWECYPSERIKAFYLEPQPPDQSVSFDFRIEGEPTTQVFLGSKELTPPELPVETKLDGMCESPVIEKAFVPSRDGFFVRRYRTEGATSRPTQPAKLDEETVNQLRSLGYIR